MLTLNKQDEWIVKDAMVWRYWEIVLSMLQDDINLLEQAILSPAIEEKSKLVYSKRDKDLITREILLGMKDLPNRILTRIKNQN